MRFGIRAKIDSTVVLRSNLSIDVGDLRLDYESDEQGYLATVSVTAQAAPESFGIEVGPGEGATKASFTVHTDTELANRMLTCLQQLESHLAFACAGSVRRIHWDTVERFRVTEEGDTEVGGLRSIAQQFRDPRPQIKASPDILTIISQASVAQSALIIPKAFWREAMNDYCERRYIQAYYNFYFVIEGFYADGEYRKSQVLDAFAKSADFNEIVERAITLLIRDRFHFPRLDALYDELGCTLDRAGTQKLILLLRGRLHHYSPDSPQEQPDPFSQNHFLSPAWLLMYLATSAIEKRDVLPRAHPYGQPER